MNFVNMTPHAITLRNSDGKDTQIPSSGVARVATVVATKEKEIINGIPVFPAPTYGAVEGLPDPVHGTYYIVSAMVFEKTDRPDVLAPGTGPNDGAIRNDKGHIVAVTRLIGK